MFASLFARGEGGEKNIIDLDITSRNFCDRLSPLYPRAERSILARATSRDVRNRLSNLTALAAIFRVTNDEIYSRLVA